MVKTKEKLYKEIQYKMARCCGTCEYGGEIYHDGLLPCSKLDELTGKDGFGVYVAVEMICKHHKKKTEKK